jgi:pimeloyl-ACP methyl ester carboxylesterase
MGGIIASAFTVRHPERVNKLVLIDPAGAKSLALTPMLKAAKMPLAAEVVLGWVGGEALVQSNAKDLFDPALVEHFKAQYKIQMQYKGFIRAILSTIRNGMLDSFIDMYQSLGKMDKAVLLFWGRNDKTVSFEHSGILRAAVPNIEFHVIENCGHIPHYEKPEIVNPILLEFLRQA